MPKVGPSLTLVGDWVSQPYRYV